MSNRWAGRSVALETEDVDGSLLWKEGFSFDQFANCQAFLEGLLIARIHAGLMREREQGRILRRRRSLTNARKQTARETLEKGQSRSSPATKVSAGRRSSGRAMKA